MKRNLDELIRGLDSFERSERQNRVVEGITCDSRNVKKNYIFVAIKGLVSDGHDYIDKALELGATTLVVDDSFDVNVKQDVVVLKSKDTRLAYALMCANWCDRPSRKLKVVGVTGTNGKTTVATLLYNLFNGLGYKVGLISTIEILIDKKQFKTSHTTPDAQILQQVLSEMVDQHCEYVFMEVSSHAVDQKRIAGIEFDVAVFTNISHDHLDYHHTFQEYIRAKKAFFDELSASAIAITNYDDKNGSVMVQNCSAKVLNYSLNSLAQYKGKLISSDTFGMLVELNGVPLMTRLTGRFNVYNLLAVYAVAEVMNIAERHEILEELSSIGAVKGRMEVVAVKPKVVVDFAHTPDALENVLRTLVDMNGRGRILTLVGCGGDRDKGKRPKMARVASFYSDQVVLTSDNPRSEDPLAIIKDMVDGLDEDALKKVIEIADRKMAIKTILALASEKDIVLIAGKGHEEYQEVNGVRTYFSDQQIVKDILSEDI